MNWTFRKLIILLFILVTGNLAPVYGAGLCYSLFTPSISKVVIPNQTFDNTTKNLRSTLKGNLATVFRSEWKTKLAILQSNRYVLNLLTSLLSEKTRIEILSGLDSNGEGFTREVHHRLYVMQVSGKMQPSDQLSVRDKPAPEGSEDTTFTYYTKPIQMKDGEGKHQVRIRTYLREVNYEEIPIGQSAFGFNPTGKQVSIFRLAVDTFRLQIGPDSAPTSTETLTTNQISQVLGRTALLHAPHGKSFKLEIKTALNDKISGEKFPKLEGDHMVQKLDSPLSPAQVYKLFSVLKNKTPQGKINESLRRIESLSNELTTREPENAERIHAVFEVIIEAVKNEPDFLSIEGATAYHRTAFETKSGLQTTIDRDQHLYLGNMYENNVVKDPITTKRKNKAIKPTDDSARHVELKVPVTAMQNAVGITFADPTTAPAPQDPINNNQIQSVISIYHNFVKNNDHAGKFNYIRKNGSEDSH